MFQQLYGKKAAALYTQAGDYRRPPASTTRRPRTRTTRPTTGPPTTTGAVLATSGTTSTPATGKYTCGSSTSSVCSSYDGALALVSCLVGIGNAGCAERPGGYTLP